MAIKRILGQLFNRKTASIVAGASLAGGAIHGGATAWRQVDGMPSGEFKDQPTEVQHGQMCLGLDALNTAYPMGDDGVWGGRDDQFVTKAQFVDIARAAKERFEFVDAVSDHGGDLDGLHSVLMRDKETGLLVFAICGMEVPAEHIVHDIPDVLNSLHLIPQSLPDQFPHVVEVFDGFQAEYGKISLVAGGSIGAMQAQLLAGGRDVPVVAFSSAGLSTSLVEDCAVYFDLSPDEIMDNMDQRCISVPATMYSAVGAQVGKVFYPEGAGPTQWDVREHGTYEMNAAVQAGEFEATVYPTAGALMVGGAAGAFSGAAVGAAGVGIGVSMLSLAGLMRRKDEGVGKVERPDLDPS